jgi:hypothetical protein
MVTGISNNQGFCGLLTRCVVGAGLTMLAYQVGGPALAAIGTIGYLWVSSSDNKRVLKGVEKVALQDRDEQDMEHWQRIGRIEAVVIDKAPVGDREEVMRLAFPLITQDMNHVQIIHRIGAVAEAVAEVPIKDREEVIRLASPFITQDIGDWEIIGLFKAVAEVPIKDREEVIRLASPFITQDMNGWDIIDLFKAVAEVPIEDREEVIRSVSRLFAPPCHYSSCTWVVASEIRSLAQMPEVERGPFVDFALLLTQNIPRDNFYDMRLIWGALWHSDIERTDRAQRALRQIPQDILHGLAHEEIAQRIVTILETPLNQPIPPLRAAMAELFEAGHNAVDVHHDRRDANTRKAVESLQKRQGQLSEEVISNAIKEFKQFLNAYGDSDLKAKAQQALDGQNREELWPPLLNNNTHAIDGGRLRISGEELIARLWLFVDQYPEKEKENCQISMIRALADSIVDGQRVCPPGQTQRLVVGVLQGRLEGADVDKVEMTTLTLNQNVAAFLSENQTCTSRDQLIANAEAFLNIHPLVNREAFLQEINSYANNMAID